MNHFRHARREIPEIYTNANMEPPNVREPLITVHVFDSATFLEENCLIISRIMPAEDSSEMDNFLHLSSCEEVIMSKYKANTNNSTFTMFFMLNITQLINKLTFN